MLRPALQFLELGSLSGTHAEHGGLADGADVDTPVPPIAVAAAVVNVLGELEGDAEGDADGNDVEELEGVNVVIERHRVPSHILRWPPVHSVSMTGHA